MRIGVAGPADLSLLAPLLPGVALPPGLGSTVVSHLVRALIDGGDSVVLYTLDESVDRLLRFDGENLTVHIGPYRRRHRMRDLMSQERRAVRDMILSDPPDVVSAHWCYEFALGARAAGYPTLVTSCDWAPTILRHKPDLYRLGRLGLFFWTLAVCRHFAAPSPYIASRMRKVSGSPCVVLGQPLEDGCFRTTPRSWPGGPPALVSIANGWGGVKNTKTLIRAFGELRHRIPNATLTFYGDNHGPDQQAERWARLHGLGEGVIFAGLVPNAVILDSLSHAHLCVHPSLEESFCQAILEALSVGTPVIAGRDAGAVPWVLESGRAGVLVDTRNAKALCESMATLLSDHERWEAYSASGLESARCRFTAKAVAARYRETLRGLVDTP